MKTVRCRIFLTTLLLLIFFIGISTDFTASPLYAETSVPRILVLNSYNMDYDWWKDEMEGFHSELSKVHPRVELYTEHLDTQKFHSKTIELS